MATRTLAQITKELAPTYAAQVKNLREQEALIPQQIQSQTEALNAQKDEAYNDILSGARRRGLGFSGIPLGEQAKYNATSFLPSLTKLQQQGNQNRLTLEQAILGVNQNRDTLAQQLYQQGLDRNFQREQLAAEKRASAAAAAQPTFGDLFGGIGRTSAPAQGTEASRQQRKDKGFNFTIGGKPVSAATYAQATRTPFRSLLQQMAKAGDAGARQALGFVGNDYGYDPRKITGRNLANIYNSLVWGSGKQANYTPPQKPAPYNPDSGYRGNAVARFF